jgi:hypothetical protein
LFLIIGLLKFGYTLTEKIKKTKVEVVRQGKYLHKKGTYGFLLCRGCSSDSKLATHWKEKEEEDNAFS